MNEHRSRDGLDSFTEGFVRKAARQLAGKNGFRRTDRQEIEQELYCKLCRHLPQANPESPFWKAFVARTVRRHVVSLIRRNRAEKRDHRRQRSLHAIVEAGSRGIVELGETIGDEARLARWGRKMRTPQELADLIADISACLENLPLDSHRELCERLKHDSLAQVARDMQIPRTTLDGWRRKVRSRCEARGLQDYLK